MIITADFIFMKTTQKKSRLPYSIALLHAQNNSKVINHDINSKLNNLTDDKKY